MAGDDLETAVRRVLPALNLEPATFELDRGFVARASGRSRPSVAALNSLANQLLFVGTLGATDLDAVAERMAGEALETILKARTNHPINTIRTIWVAWPHPLNPYTGRSRGASRGMRYAHQRVATSER